MLLQIIHVVVEADVVQGSTGMACELRMSSPFLEVENKVAEAACGLGYLKYLLSGPLQKVSHVLD